MSAIVGVLHFDGTPLDPKILARMVKGLAHRGPDAQRTWCREGVGLGHCMLWTTPESLEERQPLTSPDGAFTLTADARIDNRAELITALGFKGCPAAELTDADLILAAYQRWDEQCALRLVGDFAFAIWDENRRQLFCARDPMGVRNFYYHHGSRLFAFASEIKTLFELSEIPRELNEERIADHLTFLFEDRESTFYRHIQRLPAGHCLSVSTQGLRMHRYWALDPERELVLGSEREYEEAFRELFLEAVCCRLRCAFPVGSTLSGGLDSSAVTCAARQALKQGAAGKLHTFSAIFPSLPPRLLQRIDERPYVESVVAGGDLIAHEVHADQLSPFDELEHVLWHLDEPHLAFNLYLHLGLYRSAREQGVRVILDGLDGDTTVSHGLERLAELARSLQWRTLWREAKAIARQSPNRVWSPWGVLWSHALTPLVPVTLRRVWRQLWRQSTPGWARHSVIDEAFAHRVGLERRIRQLYGDGLHPFQGAREAHRRGLESPLFPHALELADKVAAAYRLEARYPFFDRRLMEFCLALPPDQKLREGWTRSILRRAMQGILPPEIQWRTSKADLSPNFLRGLLSLGRQRIERVLAEDGQALEPFVNLAALNRLYQRYQKQLSNADAMTLFGIVTLAVWMQQRRAGPA